MSKSIQFRRSTAVLTLVAASIGGGLIAAFAVATHSNAPVYVTAKAASNPSTKASEISSSFADVIEKASPAVVNISSTRVIKASDQKDGQGGNPFMNDPFFRQFFGGQGARPRDQRESGLGSGIIVNPAGYILTNNHVVDKASVLKVTLLDGRQFPAKLVGADPQSDVAVVKIDATNLPTLQFADSSAARVGDLCFAIGNPFGYDHTVTMGIVSAKGRSLEGGGHLQDFIQTDAAINPGNSGGALINAKGDLIGMNTAIITGGSSFGGEAGNIGIGFAVPSDMARRVMEQLIKNGKVSRGYIGVTLQHVTPDLAQQFGLKDIHAAVLNDVTPGAPGAKAGLKVGDAITAIDGQSIKDSNDLQIKVTEHTPGSVVTLNVIRDSKPITVKVTLGTRPTAANFGEPGQNEGGNNQGGNDNGNAGKSSYGITVQALTPDVVQGLQLPATVHGVVIDSVDPGSPASEAVTRGDVITSVNRHPVTSVGEFQRLMSEAGGKSVLLTVNRHGQSAFVVVQPNKE